MEQVIFKICPECDRYEVGSDGAVYNLNYRYTGRRKKLIPRRNDDGYPYVNMVINGKVRKRVIHRLLAKLFIPPVAGKNSVNHKNGIRHDNRLENLEWCTQQENLLHGYRHNGRKMSQKVKDALLRYRTGENNANAKIKRSDVVNIRALKKSGAPVKAIASRFNISYSHVLSITSGRSWKHVQC